MRIAQCPGAQHRLVDVIGVLQYYWVRGYIVYCEYLHRNIYYVLLDVEPTLL
jgi:hypothetical protein